MFYFVGKKRKK